MLLPWACVLYFKKRSVLFLVAPIVPLIAQDQAGLLLLPVTNFYCFKVSEEACKFYRPSALLAALQIRAPCACDVGISARAVNGSKL